MREATTDSTALTPDDGYPQRWRMLPVVLVVLFMAQFDVYGVNVAAPSLQSDIGAGAEALEFIVAGYAFTYASGLITGGRLGDIFGIRRMFVVGTLAFSVASLLCGLAQSPTQLVIARLVQGLAGAAMVPQVLAALTSGFPRHERHRAIAWFGFVSGLGLVGGQILGGALLQADLFNLGWRVIFLVNVPIGLATVVAAQRVLPNFETMHRPKLDPVGAIGISLSLALALVPLVLGRGEGWPLWVFIMLAAAVPVMIVALRWEQRLAARGGEPLLDLDLFRDRTLNLGLLAALVICAAFFSMLFVTTLVLQQGLGLNPLEAGLTFAPLGIAFATSSIVAQRFSTLHGRRLIIVGAVIAICAHVGLIVVLLAAGDSLTPAELIVPLAVIGAGNGLSIPTLAGVVLSGVRPSHTGAASGVYSTVQQFGGAAGVTILGTVYFAVLTPATSLVDYAHAFAAVAVVDLVLMCVAAAIGRGLPKRAIRVEILPEPIG